MTDPAPLPPTPYPHHLLAAIRAARAVLHSVQQAKRKLYLLQGPPSLRLRGASPVSVSIARANLDAARAAAKASIPPDDD